MSETMTIKNLIAALDDFTSAPHLDVRPTWDRCKAAHGLDPEPAPTEPQRWFRDRVGCWYEYPSKRMWGRSCNLLPYKPVCTPEDHIEAGSTEMDGPPPHGKPLVVNPPAPAPAPAVHERWFAVADTVKRGEHQKGRHLTWRLKSDRSVGRYWKYGKDRDEALAYKTFADAEAAVACSHLIELDPATGEPLVKPTTKPSHSYDGWETDPRTAKLRAELARLKSSRRPKAKGRGKKKGARR